MFAPLGGKAESVAIGYGVMLPSLHAVFVNGTSAHSIEMDDGLFGTHVHPAGSVVSTALALAQRDKTTPREFLTAILAGYEVTFRLGQAMFPHHARRGFHPTGTCGTFGAAATAANLLKLNLDETANTLGYAGTQAMALMVEGGGIGAHQMKRFHAGKAALNGLLAASLAREGLAAPHSILEGKGGFLQIGADKYDTSKLINGLGKQFVTEGSYVKPYPSCRHSHATIDSMLYLRTVNHLKPEDVEGITVKIYREGAESAEKEPDSITDAQFSIPYCLAVALYDGEVFMEQFSSQKIQDPKIRALAQKVEVVFDAKLDEEYLQTKKYAHLVQVRKKDGAVIERRTDYPRGSFENPMSLQDIRKKFEALSAAKLDSGHRDKLAHFILTLDGQKDLTELWNLLIC